jgi:hypothetical protein
MGLTGSLTTPDHPCSGVVHAVLWPARAPLLQEPCSHRAHSRRPVPLIAKHNRWISSQGPGQLVLAGGVTWPAPICPPPIASIVTWPRLSIPASADQHPLPQLTP